MKGSIDKEYKKEELEDLTSTGNMFVCSGHNSASRAMMSSNMQKQTVIPVNAEPPHVNSSYYEKLTRSSFIKTVEDDMTVLKVVSKIIGGRDTGVKYIFYQKGDSNTIYMEHFTPYMKTKEEYGEVCYLNETLKDGAILKKGEILSHPHPYDPVVGSYGMGVNLITLHTLNQKTCEDAIVLSDKVADNIKLSYVYQVSFEVPDRVILKNLFGDERSYQPIPFIGDDTNTGLMLAMVKNVQPYKFLVSNDDLKTVSDTDFIKVFAEAKNPILYDMDIIKGSDQEMENVFLRDRFKEILTFKRELLDVLVDLNSKCPVTEDISLLKDRLYLETTDKNIMYRNGKKEIKNPQVTLYFADIRPINICHKMCGPSGNKGVYVHRKSHDDMLRTADGTVVEMELNINAVVNRSIISVPYVITISHLSMKLEKHFNEHGWDFDILMGYFNILDPDMVTAVKKLLKDKSEDTLGFMKAVKEYGIRPTLKPISNGLDISTFLELSDYFTSHGITHGVEPLYDKDGNHVCDGEIGKMFSMILKQNGSNKASHRILGSYNETGLPVKSKDSKSFESKISDTPIKISEIDVLLFKSYLGDSIFDKMRETVGSNAIAAFRAYAIALGVDFGVMER